MIGIVYRQATVSDVDTLIRLRWDFRTESDEIAPLLTREEFESGCRTFLLDGLRGSWTYWVAEHADQIVAHAFVQRVSMVPNPNRLRDEWGYLTNCYTIPQYRSRGIGTELLNRVVAWAQENDFELLIVWPSDESRALYKRIGFAEKNEILDLRLR